MSEKPILFSGEMVRTILDGNKTQTRRVVKSKPRHNQEMACPYGRNGDRLWVRETFGMLDCHHGQTVYRADGKDRFTDILWRPSIFMPRWASRITLEITCVRVQPLQDISEFDCIAEGVSPCGHDGFCTDQHTCSYKKLWNSINAKRGFAWEKNPWVWVIEFRTIAQHPAQNQSSEPPS
jgi:hypothetical protein